MRLGLAGVLLAVCLALPAARATAQDCVGPVAEDVEPGTPAWDRRESDNVYCGQQRSQDLASNPVYQAELAQQPPGRLQDPLRAPERYAGHRFRYDELSFAGFEGTTRPAAVFRPCDASCSDVPAALGRFQAPYPAVVIVHGGAANQEMYLWASEALAEAGYLVLTFQIPNDADTHTEDLRKALDFLFSPAFPYAAQLDRAHVGIAGHSAGGVAVSRVGQEDPRVGAVVSWDRAQSTALPKDVALRTPALYFTADFNCQKVPVCQPVPYADRPDPKGPGDKDGDFARTAAAGADSMKVSLRAATHLDFSVLPTGVGSRYGQAVTSYYTLAWFDRYLRGSTVARARLVAERFDGSADLHQLSGGVYDPATNANVGALLSGLPVRDRLSFHFRSAWALDGGRYLCEDMRADGCDRSVPLVPAPCRPRRFARVRVPRGARSVRVRVDGARFRGARARRGRVRVDLRSLAAGRHRIVVRFRGRDGRAARRVRRVTVCARP